MCCTGNAQSGVESIVNGASGVCHRSGEFVTISKPEVFGYVDGEFWVEDVTSSARRLMEPRPHVQQQGPLVFHIRHVTHMAQR